MVRSLSHSFSLRLSVTHTHAHGEMRMLPGRSSALIQYAHTGFLSLYPTLPHSRMESTEV